MYIYIYNIFLYLLKISFPSQCLYHSFDFFNPNMVIFKIFLLFLSYFVFRFSFGNYTSILVVMASDDLETLSTVNYYMVEGYYRHVQMIAIDSTRKFGPDPVLQFYKSISMLADGQVQESIRDLEIIKDKQNVTLAAHIALLSAVNKSHNADQNGIKVLENKIRELKQNATESELLFAVIATWFVGGGKGPKEYTDRLIKQYPDCKKGYILKAWTDFIFERELASKKAGKLFDHGLLDNHDPFGIIGKARHLVKYRKLRQALEIINQAVILYPNFVPAMIERAKIYLALQDWDQMMESTKRVLSINHHHPEALRLQILYCVSQEGQYAESVNKLGELIQVIDRFEPQNHELYFNSGRLFSRICGRNLAVLNQSYTLVERSVSLVPENPYYLNELAFQVFLKGKYQEAIKRYNDTVSIDETNVQALQGIVQCRLKILEQDQSINQETLKDISDHLEFLLNINSPEHHEAELLYLEGLADFIKGKSQDIVCTKLQDTLKQHFVKLGNIVLGIEYFLAMDPSFLMDIVKLLFKLSPYQPILSGQVVPPSLNICKSVLDTLVKVLPGMMEALYYNAKVKYLSADMDGAAASLQLCLNQDSTFGDAHLLMAQIHQNRGNHSATTQYLETALSFNFEIRDHPLYHLIKAQALRETGNIVECIQTLKLALALPGVRRPQSSLMKQNRKFVGINSGDRLSIFLQLVQAHTANEEHHEAAKVMQDAMNAFQGTTEEIRVRISNAELSVKRGDVEQALAMLRAITPNQPYYLQAKEKMADIYLHQRKDKKLYASCYRDLLEKQPTQHSSLLLGDAYMKIQEPEKAIAVYEQAFRNNPKDGTLASKIGQALIKTHDFKKAIAYYESALKSDGDNKLHLELAEFLIKTKSFGKAKRVLQQAANSELVGSELDTMLNETKRLLLLATLNRESGEHDEELVTLTKARDTQAKVLKRVQVEQPDIAVAQKQLAASICCNLAEHSQAHDNVLDQAIKYYKEALIYSDNDTKIMLNLARLFLQMGDLDSCQQYCMQSLRLTANVNDQASMMMADVMFSKKSYADAIYHYQKLLQVRPDHYEALGRLIGLLRRGGQLKDVKQFLDSAQSKVGEGRALMASGFQYCKGIYSWYSGNASEALQLLNLARCDAEWSEKALEAMIRICLNPDQQTLGGEVFESLNDIASDKHNTAHDNALSTAERLVKELKSSDPFKVQVFESMVLVSTKHKPNAERALSNLVAVSQKKKDYVPALLGMAIAYQILKQTPRARNQLKRISKMQWNSDEAEDFEQAWLLLADVYITSGKYDMATELLKKCLDHNKSCSKAYEYLGYIYEKEQSYKDAANNYEKAWEYSNETNPVIGYKLAFNYMKAKRNVDAINISHKVLAQNPNYPRMRKEILDKARAGLRV